METKETMIGAGERRNGDKGNHDRSRGREGMETNETMIGAGGEKEWRQMKP